jgi:hypothetical protein
MKKETREAIEFHFKSIRVLMDEPEVEPEPVPEPEPDPEPDYASWVGKLIEVYQTGKWIGPMLMINYEPADEFPFCVIRNQWKEARLYQGPLLGNWIEHDGKVIEQDSLTFYLVKFRAGDHRLCMVGPGDNRDYFGLHQGGGSDVVAYQIIDPELLGGPQ